MSLTRYFLWFFLYCFLFTCLCGVLAALMPQGLGAILTIVPYLLAMILVLFRFLKKERRAPTQSERKKITLGLSCIYWGYNFSFLLLGMAWASRSNPNVWLDLGNFLQQPQFMSIVVVMILLIAIPLYLITYWFYGKQAQRMADRMF